MNAKPGERLLTLFSGPLRITHIFDYVYLRDVCAGLTADLVARSIRLSTTPCAAGAWPVRASAWPA